MTPPDDTPWRPIASAPRDGTRVLLYSPTLFNGYVGSGWWDWDKYGNRPRPFWFYCGSQKNLSRMNPPTHWCPLPLPPMTEPVT